MVGEDVTTVMDHDRLPPLRTWLPRAAVPILLVLTTGCASVWWNSFLDPSQVGNFHDNNVVNEIQQTISFRDTPGGVPGATE